MEKLTAFEYGKMAYRKGIYALALDEEFINNCLTGLNFLEGIKPMKEWQKGWNQALKED
jgi:hypothetical protein